MRVNQKVRYGVACLYELSKYKDVFTDADFIAHRQEIPTAFAQKILHQLAQSGIVLGMKGSGYQLARPLESITILHVMEALMAEHITEENSRNSSTVIEQRIKQALGSISLSCLGQQIPNL